MKKHANHIYDLRQISKLSNELADVLETSNCDTRPICYDVILNQEKSLEINEIASSDFRNQLNGLLQIKHYIEGLGYLSNYGLTEKEIISFIDELERFEISLDIFLYNEEKIQAILDLFVAIGVTNIYGIMLEAPYVFCDTVSSVKRRIDNYPDKEELAKLLNEDASNLQLIHMA